MAPLSQAQVIECFHLAFLGVLGVRLDPGRYVLKGGANLRYFFASVRYSEDIDIDVSAELNRNLEGKIDAILDSPALTSLLRSCGIEVGDFAKPKQTDTTRRWKVSLLATGHSQPVRTKVEFSNRNGEDGCAVEAVPDRVVKAYGVRPPLVQHYEAQPAIQQKVRALAGRSETQARDVFDLELLLRKTSLDAGALDNSVLNEAAEKGSDLTWQAFADQVLPFLDPEVAELYTDSGVWAQIQSFVVETLLEAQ